MNWEKFSRVEGSSMDWPMVSCAELLDSFYGVSITYGGRTGKGTETRGLFSKPSVMAFSTSLYSSSVPLEG